MAVYFFILVNRIQILYKYYDIEKQVSLFKAPVFQMILQTISQYLIPFVNNIIKLMPQAINYELNSLISTPQRINRYYKFLILVFMFSAFLFWSYSHKNTLEYRCILDRMHNHLYFMNKQLRNSAALRNIFLGIGQCTIDMWFIVISIVWVLFIKNSRFPSSVAIFYTTRARFLELVKFPFPKSVVWQNPGFPSITVPYDHTRDFFFSGHTGILTIILCQLLTIRFGIASIICFFSLAYIILMLLTTQVHYTVDIFGGLLFAIYIHSLVSQYLFYFDWLLSVPWVLGRKLQNGIKKLTLSRV